MREDGRVGVGAWLLRGPLPAVASVLALLALWWVMTQGLVPAYVLPPPGAVLAALWDGLRHGPLDEGGLWYHLGITLWEALLGFVLGSASGVAVGVLIAQSRLLERFSMPLIVGFQAVPKVALAPLLVIWFGFGIQGKVLMTAVLTFFPLLVNSIAGCRAVEPERVDLARVCNASRGQILRWIVLPSAMPFIFTGLNVASVLALLGALVGEFVGAEAGLGQLLVQYDQQMQIAPVFAVVIVLGVVGYAFNALIRCCERAVCFWAQRGGPPGGGY